MSATLLFCLFAVSSASRMLVNPITGRSVPVIVPKDSSNQETLKETHASADDRSVTQLKRFTRQLWNDSSIVVAAQQFFGGKKFPVNVTVGEHNSEELEGLEGRLGGRRVKSDSEELEGIEGRLGDRRVKNRVKNIPKQACELDTRDDLPKDNEPLYVTEDGLAITPQLKYNRSILTPLSGRLYLACIGQDNYLLTGGKQVSEARCLRDDGYEIEGRKVNLKAVTCKSANRATVNQTHSKCGSGNLGHTYDIGFQVGGSWQKLMSVCHNVKAASTLYVDHVVSKLTDVGAVRENARGSFKEGHSSLFSGLSVNNLYKRKNQKETLLNIVGQDPQLDGKDIYLSRGHLAADADYIFSSHQQSTYFYINVAPQWYTVNAGNWLSIERKVKRVSYKRGLDAVVRSGTHGVLRLRDTSSIPREVYLEPNSRRIPVPAFFWKAVAVGQEGIVFVVSNNPLSPPEQTPCKDICSSTGWRFERPVTEGRVFCCTFADASRKIPDVPLMKIKSILTWP